MESSTQKRALGLKDKIPDIQKTLETVQFLKSRDVCPESTRSITPIKQAGLIQPPPQDDAEPLETSFELNDTLFAKANIEKVDEVYLWLGVRYLVTLHVDPTAACRNTLQTKHTPQRTQYKH